MDSPRPMTAARPQWLENLRHPELDLGELEVAFRQSTIRADAGLIRIVLSVYIVAMVLYVINDYQLFGLSQAFPVMLLIRAVLIANAAFIMRSFSHLSSFDAIDRMTLMGWLVGIFFHLYIIYSRPASLTYLDLMFILAIYLALPNRFYYRLIPALAFSIGDFVLFMVFRSDQGAVGLLALGLALLIGNFIGLATSIRLYRYRREQFLAHKQIEELAGQLRDANEVLDQKVRERTAQLAEANTALTKANRQLQELDQLKSGFLGVITHELRSPFVNINMSLQLIERYGMEHLLPEQREQLRELTSGVQSAKAMIDNLVKYATFFSKQGELHLTSVTPGQVIENALVPLHFQAQRKGVTLDILAPSDLPALRVDKALLAEAIYHLTHNAVKFTPTGGKVTLHARVEGGSLHFEVNDTGCGIPAERLSTLWDSFSQMADPLLRGVEGLGLGLALVKYVVNAHGGEVWAESREGVGSTFGFHLPISVLK